MVGKTKLPDPFGQRQWISTRRWINGANVGRLARGVGDLSDRYFRGQASYEARSATARRTLEANEGAFSRVPAVHHVAISDSKRTADNRSGLCITAYLKPGSRVEDAAAGLPREIRALRTDGSELGYAFPVKIAILPAEPVTFAFKGGDSIRGGRVESGVFQSGTCCFAFWSSGKKHFITNTHVICEPDQNPINTGVDCCDYPLGTCVDAALLKSNAVNTLDAAVLKCTGSVNISAMTIEGWRKPIVGKEDPWKGSPHTYFYVAWDRTVACVRPESVPGKFTMEYHDGRILTYAKFWKLTTEGDLPDEGDSGAALFREGTGGLLIAGIVFGGMRGFNQVFVFPASRVWEEFF